MRVTNCVFTKKGKTTPAMSAEQLSDLSDAESEGAEDGSGNAVVSENDYKETEHDQQECVEEEELKKNVELNDTEDEDKDEKEHEEDDEEEGLDPPPLIRQHTTSRLHSSDAVSAAASAALMETTSHRVNPQTGRFILKGGRTDSRQRRASVLNFGRKNGGLKKSIPASKMNSVQRRDYGRRGFSQDSRDRYRSGQDNLERYRGGEDQYRRPREQRYTRPRDNPEPDIWAQNGF